MTRPEPATSRCLSNERATDKGSDRRREVATTERRPTLPPVVSGTVPSSVIVEDPALGGEEVECRDEGDDGQQQPGHRRGVSHVELAEAALIQIQRVEQRQVGR